ncbi:MULTISPECIES: SDR family oxidoreductase [unclassified Variovorax]|jgi:NAD(P)-dependent dehydrogenase (short-subunit alcohol dehydrogenase family)|uniref:SDR family oxidoreductase n=1 Tax=unclassified Variovorax TaxID=663243 RepID=UPI001990FD4C|nr:MULTISPECIES: SDR family oxidoreductase [unclassified Variovorax]MBC7393154.1 SDR family oxidoreductase [Variovorax sp.]MEB0059145.1 SDR family oxidoreductase [Variovorax sp. LG9.2]MEB0112876.1 SDR family oxidoreductase [Variovorax sp. RTB1]
MDLQLEHQHILITGGSKGIGLACALGFLREGARVSLVSRDQANLDQAKRTLLEQLPDAASRVALYAADLKLPSEAIEALDAAEGNFGPVDVLVNSAGAAKRTPPDLLDAMVWHEAMEAKYFTTIHMIDPVVKRMGQRGRGAIVNVVGAGGKVASPVHMPGGAANAALMLVSAGMAVAYAPRGVRVNAVNPGLTLTTRLQEGLAVDAKAQGIDMDEALKRATARLPLGRIATPEEIANAVVFLASSKASYITGAILAMDGAVTPMV